VRASRKAREAVLTRLTALIGVRAFFCAQRMLMQGGARERSPMSTVERSDRQRDTSSDESERWTVAMPPILGEISSDEKPGPIAPGLLLRLASGTHFKPRPRAYKRRPLPRIATTENQKPDPEDEDCESRLRRALLRDNLLDLVPGAKLPKVVRPPMRPQSPAPETREARRPKNQRSISETNAAKHFRRQRRNKAERKALLVSQKTCHDCGRQLVLQSSGPDRAMLAERSESQVLVCRGCSTGPKEHG